MLLIAGTKLDLDPTTAGEKASLEAANRHATIVVVTLNLTMFVEIILFEEIGKLTDDRSLDCELNNSFNADCALLLHQQD